MRNELKWVVNSLRFFSIIFFIAGMAMILGGVRDVRANIDASIFFQFWISILIGFFILFLVNIGGIINGIYFVGFAIVFEIIAILIYIYATSGSNNTEKKELQYVSYIFVFLLFILSLVGMNLVHQGAYAVRGFVDLIIIITWFYNMFLGFLMLFMVNTAGIVGGTAVIGAALVFEITVMILGLIPSTDIEDIRMSERIPIKDTISYKSQREIIGISKPNKPQAVKYEEMPINQTSISRETIPSAILREGPQNLFIATEGISFSKGIWDLRNNYAATLIIYSNGIIIKPIISILSDINIQINQISKTIQAPNMQIIEILLKNNERYSIHFNKMELFNQFCNIISKIRGESVPDQLQIRKQEKEVLLKKPKLEEPRDYIKKISGVYDEISFEKLIIKTNYNVTELENLIEEMIINGEIQAKIKPNSVVFLNKNDITEERKLKKMNDYLVKVLKIRLAKGEITEEDYDRLVEKIKI